MTQTQNRTQSGTRCCGERMIDMRTLVDNIIQKLENEGIDEVWAWFARPPHAVVYRALDGYNVVLWRGRVRVVVKLNEKYEIKSAHVEYGD